MAYYPQTPIISFWNLTQIVRIWIVILNDYFKSEMTYPYLQSLLQSCGAIK